MSEGEAAAGRIIIVDDEAGLREPLAEYLALEGYDAVPAESGVELDRLLAEKPADLVVLDVNMPGENGFSIAQRLRAAGPVGIIMLTSKRDLVDRVVGLEVGADDYVSKPCDPRELLARARAVLRRLNVQAPPAAEPETEGSDYVSEFWIRGNEGAVRVSIDSLEWIEADKDYVLLHGRGGRSHILRITMSALEQRLDPAVMLRVHRSVFVSPAAVAVIGRKGRNPCVTLRSGAEAPVSPKYLDELERRVGKSVAA